MISKRLIPQEVRHIQMGRVRSEIRLTTTSLALSEGEIAALTTSMHQIGVGTQGGALAFFHQLLNDEWVAGSLIEPLARIKVDEKNSFGMINARGSVAVSLQALGSSSVDTSELVSC